MTSANDLQPRPVSFALPLHKPVATWVLLGMILVTFAVETAAGGSTETTVLIRMGAKVTALIAAGQYWRLFTSMFLHVGLLHLAFNCYALFVIGTELERLLGWRRFLTIYLLSGLFGSLASYALNPGLSAGASGAIFGLIGALAAFFALHRDVLGAWGRRRLSNIVFLIVLNLFLGFTQPAIDNLAHLGGLLSGLALGWALAPRYQVDPVEMRLVDRNNLGRYWPALALAVLLLVGGTVLATLAHQNSPATRLFRAQQALDRESWDEAVVELEQAVGQDPTLADAYFYLGLARNHLGQTGPAVEAYRSALALEPEFSPAHWNLALTYLDMGRDSDAQAHFEAYLELNPDAQQEVQPYLDELRQVSP